VVHVPGTGVRIEDDCGVAVAHLVLGQGAHKDRRIDGIDRISDQVTGFPVPERIHIGGILGPENQIGALPAGAEILRHVDVVGEDCTALRVEV